MAILTCGIFKMGKILSKYIHFIRFFCFAVLHKNRFTRRPGNRIYMLYVSVKTNSYVYQDASHWD